MGHIGVTLFIGYLFQRFSKSDYTKYSVFLGIGSMLPDIIDKPIGSIFFETGRWLGHSVIVLSTMFIVSWYFGRGKHFHGYDTTLIFQIVFIGSLFHLLEDVGISKIVVFWPLFGNFPIGASGDFLQGFRDPFTIIFEFIGLVFIIIIGINDRWRKNYWIILLGMIIAYLVLFLTTYALIVGF